MPLKTEPCGSDVWMCFITERLKLQSPMQLEHPTIIPKSVSGIMLTFIYALIFLLYIAVRFPSKSVKQTDVKNCGKYILCLDCKSKYVPSASVNHDTVLYGRSTIAIGYIHILCIYCKCKYVPSAYDRSIVVCVHWVYYCVLTAIQKRSYRSRRDLSQSFLSDPLSQPCKD